MLGALRILDVCVAVKAASSCKDARAGRMDTQVARERGRGNEEYLGGGDGRNLIVSNRRNGEAQGMFLKVKRHGTFGL